MREIDEKPVCIDCAESMATCEECEEPTRECISVGDKQWCSDCVESESIECGECDERTDKALAVGDYCEGCADERAAIESERWEAIEWREPIALLPAGFAPVLLPAVAGSHRVTIPVMLDSGERSDIEGFATMHSALAIHPDPNSRGEYALTHIPTGLRMIPLGSLGAMFEIASDPAIASAPWGEWPATGSPSHRVRDACCAAMAPYKE